MSKEEYLLLAKIARGYKLDSAWAIDRWLSEPTTLEYIEFWEYTHNMDFDSDAYIAVCQTALSLGVSPSIDELVNKCNVKGLFVRGDNLFAHCDIAFDFALWIAPSFRALCRLNNESNLRKEEDYIVSKQNLAEIVKEQALENYEYYVKSNLGVQETC